MEEIAGYVPLLITVGCIVAFIHIMRLSQHLKRNLAWIGAVNYLVAEIASGLWWAAREQSELGRWEITYGILTGLLFVAAYFLIEAGIRFLGVGITQTFERLSACLIPVAATIIIWGHLPKTAIQWLGLVLAVVSLPLLGKGRGKHQGGRSAGKLVLLIPALLIIPGAASVVFAAYEKVRGADPQPAFFTLIFLVAVIANVLVARKTHRLGLPEILLGVMLGIANFLSNYFFYQAINAMRDRGYILFPSIAAGVILISLAVAAVVWKERYRPRVLVGIAIAFIALILINIPPPKEKKTPEPRQQKTTSVRFIRVEGSLLSRCCCLASQFKWNRMG